MSTLGMKGSYEFSTSTVDAQVTRTRAGNYALGYVNSENKFIVQYVGRSDSDLNGQLKAHLPSVKYKRFKYCYNATFPKGPFEKQCQNYHDFGENGSLDNHVHPDRPKKMAWKCPVCKIFV